MSYKSVFRRYELKYLLTEAQRDFVLLAMADHMRLDSYGHTTIRNVYYDTDNYRLIRRSIEKPSYKEKLRIRSYSLADRDSTVFVELKKKYNRVVYKRRIALPEAIATDWLSGSTEAPCDTQISREIDYFKSYYEGLHPTMFLSYERDAYYDINGGDFRVTFDTNILARQTDISLCTDVYGTSILPKDRILMELKCPGAIPLWMVKALSEGEIYKTPFSKYGRAYIDMVLPTFNNKLKEIHINA
ncbi:MAG: polyphosphate polymerase domain-containing protein [Clostridia bacterium]|nr:polyphosphate polymerase domain-containing protein [Clostridia bacterium]